MLLRLVLVGPFLITQESSTILAAAIVSTVPGLFLTAYVYLILHYADVIAFSDKGMAILTCVLTCEIIAAVLQVIGGIIFIVVVDNLAYGVSASVCGIISGVTGFCSQVCCCTLLCIPNTREGDPGRLL